MTSSVDPDQLASSEVNWSGSTLFAKAGFILAQQDNMVNESNYFLKLQIFYHDKTNHYR